MQLAVERQASVYRDRPPGVQYSRRDGMFLLSTFIGWLVGWIGWLI